MMCVGAALVAGGWALAQAFGGADVAGSGEAAREVAQLQASLAQKEKELAELRSRAAQSDRQIQIDGAAAGDLAKQVKALTSENAALKEDLAFFQSLMSRTGAREGAISVNRFRLHPQAAAGEYRYRLLLVQNGERPREFHGRLQLVLNVQHDGRKVVLVLPAEAEREGSDFQLNFRFFQRIEGTFKLKPGSVLKGMQVRVFEKGARSPKLTQTLGVS
jgi:hypothetical protein